MFLPPKYGISIACLILIFRWFSLFPHLLSNSFIFCYISLSSFIYALPY
ncbi:hypothetical protein HOLDEFILI_03452 [Holdemania filiformis DSM 12042]|uniref:Uncharacterized protein n=1 Tax=Holdemania filiformis DSM 12042 TaxID=545696 RepID=B9YC92_9FIRM|nr:hypothetical protein HOLDEFILI_03452 [Holdemania filiformis DSM 12042]